MSVMDRLAAPSSRRFAARTVAASALALGVLAGVGAIGATAATAPSLPSGCSGSSPIKCHYDVSPGNYDVTVSIGSSTAAGQTAMWVEARRLMLPTTSTAAGTVKQYSFTINVRYPEGQPTGEGGTGTPGLDMQFTGSAPQVSAISVKAASSPLVAYLAGDSTVCDQLTAPYTGWGQIFPSSFGPGAVIANYADSGESSGSFLSNSVLYPAIVAKLKTGDLVFIQFGHNDKTTTAADYRSHLTTMADEARAKGGIPVLVTPPVRHLFSGNQLTSTALHVNSVGVNLPAEMRSVATSLNVPLIDLTAKSAALVTSLGPTASAALYLQASVDGVTDNTHFSQTGATKMAGLVVQGEPDAGSLPALVGFNRREHGDGGQPRQPERDGRYPDRRRASAGDGLGGGPEPDVLGHGSSGRVVDQLLGPDHRDAERRRNVHGVGHRDRRHRSIRIRVLHLDDLRRQHRRRLLHGLIRQERMGRRLHREPHDHQHQHGHRERMDPHLELPRRSENHQRLERHTHPVRRLSDRFERELQRRDRPRGQRPVRFPGHLGIQRHLTHRLRPQRHHMHRLTYGPSSVIKGRTP